TGGFNGEMRMVEVTFDRPTSVTQPAVRPTLFSLEANYPNPFNSSTVIHYQLPVNSLVELAIFNVQGQRVRTLVHADQSAGRHRSVWNGRNDAGDPVPSGVYLYRIKARKFCATRRLILMR
ncbi:MAG: FlgD immunoglobulin-like domain containing protein, partial [candidate division KSB1 bacterium]|nr:FlgD immunoglobulin-like domain containing protein [candidate division KSB1 bacterium]